MIQSQIELRGVNVHNLSQVDVDIPRNQLVVVCGVSGSGKTSLALDTLYAEGQRRYVESFSAYTRQYLEQLEKPDVQHISGLPASIAVTRGNATTSVRSTVGTATELVDYLRLLFARAAQCTCPTCGRAIQRDSTDTVLEALSDFEDARRFMVAFRVPGRYENWAEAVGELQEQGFVRMVAEGRTFAIPDCPSDAASLHDALVVVDRLTTDRRADSRLRDSLETAFRHGAGRCCLLIQALPADGGGTWTIDGRAWRYLGFSQILDCGDCGGEYPSPEPRLFSFNSPLGACPRCEGFGNLLDLDMDLIVPDKRKSIRAGAIAPWNTPAYRHEWEELMALAEDYALPVDLPFEQLTSDHVRLLREGVPERDFGGLNGFFEWLERRKYKVHVRVFMSRWRSERACPECHGMRLRPAGLAWRIAGKTISQVTQMEAGDAAEFFQELQLAPQHRQVARNILEQVRSRLHYLQEVGLAYLTLDRPLRSLSGGEAHRVGLTTAIGSSLVNMLYVLDEPSVGLHPIDTGRLLDSLYRLRDRGNSVVVVEHDESILRAADHVVEVGPGAGERGGRIMFSGSPQAMEASEESLTGDYLTGRRGRSVPCERRGPQKGSVRLTNARGHTLQGITVEFPLGGLCVVAGVSGAGKSTLVQDTLYPALCIRKRKEAPRPPLPYDDVFGDGQLDDVVGIDQTPIGRSPRSNPVTYVKAFDAIRAVFAGTIDARTRNYSASQFSFNVDGGRCPTCKGDGYVNVDMQFLNDVLMKCADCQGKRYRREILEVMYRNKSIADVLHMSVREALHLFRGHEKVQLRLRSLMEVGLDYLRLGQPANTLSAGESQRLKLAAYLAKRSRNRTLFLLDEPTTGLHFSDIVQLLDCFDELLEDGHSLIVVEHNLQLMLAADYIIELGPGASRDGGRIVGTGTPEQLAANPESPTGRALRVELERFQVPPD